MKFLAYFFIALVAAAVIFGLWSIGGPTTARNQRLDSQRLSDLQGLQNQIIYYWQGKGRLPAALSDMADPTRGVYIPTDPETKEQYSYSLNGDLAFTLCANFSASNADSAVQTKVAVPMGAYGENYSWTHGVGKVCFDRKIDPAFYKPIK